MPRDFWIIRNHWNEEIDTIKDEESLRKMIGTGPYEILDKDWIIRHCNTLKASGAVGARKLPDQVRSTSA